MAMMNTDRRLALIDRRWRAWKALERVCAAHIGDDVTLESARAESEAYAALGDAVDACREAGID